MTPWNPKRRDVTVITVVQRDDDDNYCAHAHVGSEKESLGPARSPKAALEMANEWALKRVVGYDLEPPD